MCTGGSGRAWRGWAALVLLAAAPASAAPAIDVVTMGGGDHLFSHFGHAAICVTDEASPRGRCYNFGTADFGSPGPLTWDFVRGRAIFWVSVQDMPRMLAAYRAEDRTVWVQRLDLPEAQAEELARSLAETASGESRFYRYHHFDDNCSTRVRDAIDRALGGALATAAPGAKGTTFREHAREGLSGDPFLAAGVELLLGRRADRAVTPWEAMFLPDALREQVATRLGATPEVVYERVAPLPRGDPRRGRLLLAASGVALGLLVAGAARAGRPRSAALLAGLVPGAIALVPWSLAIASPLAELRWNEVLLVLLPTDALLGLLPAPARRRYLDLRLAGIGLVLLLRIAGVLVQPLLAPVLLCLPALVALRIVRPVRAAGAAPAA